MRIDGSTCERTCLDEESGGIVLRRLHPRIASYNDLVMFLVRSNMDIKFIGSGEAAKALLYYVTDYITKPSLPAHVGLGALSYAIQKTNEKFPESQSGLCDATMARGALTITVNKMMSSQEVLHQQVMSYLVGGGDVYRSHTFRLLYWSAFDRMFRAALHENSTEHTSMSESVEPAIDGQGDEPFVLSIDKRSGSISTSNQQQDYVYRTTDAPFDQLCLYEFVATVEKEAIKRAAAADADADAPISGATQKRRGPPAGARGCFSSDRHPQFATHRLRQRKVYTVPVVLGERIPRSDRGEEEREQWARVMSILFVPWRRPGDLRTSGESWIAAFERHRVRISERNMEIIRNMNVLSECRDVRDSFRNMRRTEALAMMRDGLGTSAGRNEHSGHSDDHLDGEFELFERAGSDDVYHAVHDLAVSQVALDGKVGPRAREMLDICYGSQVAATENRAVTSDGVASSRLRSEDDDPNLTKQSLVMKTLKRQRRPDFADEEQDCRPTKRRAVQISANVERATVDESSVRSRAGSHDEESPPSIAAVMECVIQEMKLNDNPEQELAFRIVAEHLPCGSDQLFLYIAGVGGTGKTYVVSAILRLFALLGRSREVLVGAPTGAAALNINGYTVHSLTMLQNKGKKALAELKKLWSPVKYFVIDEI
ncbi:hypothetical protein OH77DRAFT_1465904 [Trametes cingulata]|nr:hypothetical protein OH77DRAFT_1465904 [Trametes cingulata]